MMFLTISKRTLILLPLIPSLFFLFFNHWIIYGAQSKSRGYLQANNLQKQASWFLYQSNLMSLSTKKFFPRWWTHAVALHSQPDRWQPHIWTTSTYTLKLLCICGPTLSLASCDTNMSIRIVLGYLGALYAWIIRYN